MADNKTEERLLALEKSNDEQESRLERLEQLAAFEQGAKLAATAIDDGPVKERKGWRDVYLTAANVIQLMDGAEWQGNHVKVKAEPELRSKLLLHFEPLFLDDCELLEGKQLVIDAKQSEIETLERAVDAWKDECTSLKAMMRKALEDLD